MRREFVLPEDRPVIVMTEEVVAPLARTWVARYEPLYVAQWWRPRGYVNPIVEVDLVQGGRWRVVQRDPEGNEFAFYGQFTEVETHRHTVQTFVSELFPTIVTELTTEFMATEAGIRIVTTHDLGSDHFRRGYIRLGGVERMAEQSDHFGRLLRQLRSRKS